MFHVAPEDCIECGLCPLLAPDHFSAGPDGPSICHRQPVTPAEVELCRDALDSCPTGAIHGDDQAPVPSGTPTSSSSPSPGAITTV